MPRLRIKPARKHQHKKRAYRDAQSAHSVPQFNPRMIVIPGRLAISTRIARQKSQQCLHSMIAPIEREPGTPRTDAADQSIFKTRSTGRAHRPRNRNRHSKTIVPRRHAEMHGRSASASSALNESRPRTKIAALIQAANSLRHRVRADDPAMQYKSQG